MTKTELTDLRNQLQQLQIELQSQLSMKGALEGTLNETNGRYASMMMAFQAQVSSLEAQLQQLRIDIDNQRQEYDMLLDMKTRLEMEIAEYRRLLDGEGDGHSINTRTKTIVITEEIVDGKVVSSMSS